MSWRILITARVFKTLGKPALELLAKSGCEVVMPEKLGPLKIEDLLPSIEGFDATLCSPDEYNAAALQSPATKRLKVISRWGVGFDSIDIAEATRQGVVVAYTPGMLNETVADWTWALLLAIARRVPQGHISVAKGEWTNYWGHNVHGKTLGLIGCGPNRPGRRQTRRGFDMRVIGYDIAPCKEPTNIQFVSLDELLAQSDFISLHAALTPENRGLIGETQLRKMKPTTYLVNTARGQLIDEPALARALKEERIAGAALDVFSIEPLLKDNPLREAPKPRSAPHQASFARETGERVSYAAAEAIVDLMQGRKAKWVVDPNVYSSPNLRVKITS
jgi:phosphoglycerate dehydrogenase-like enzyme